MVDLNAGVLIVVRISVDVTKDGRDTSTEGVVQKHLTDGTVEQRVGRVGLNTHRQFVDHGTCTSEHLSNVSRCRDDFGDGWEFVDMIRTAINRCDSDVLSRLQRNGTDGSK